LNKEVIVYMIHGFIGYGKTTFAKKLVEETGAVKFTHDEWMLDLYGDNPQVEREVFEEYCRVIQNKIDEMASEFLKRGHSVIIDTGFWARKERNAYRDRVKSWGAKPVLYSVECSLETAKERVRKRTAEMPEGAMFINDEAMDFLWTKFEPLHDDEERVAVKG